MWPTIHSWLIVFENHFFISEGNNPYFWPPWATIVTILTVPHCKYNLNVNQETQQIHSFYWQSNNTCISSDVNSMAFNRHHTHINECRIVMYFRNGQLLNLKPLFCTQTIPKAFKKTQRGLNLITTMTVVPIVSYVLHLRCRVQQVFPLKLWALDAAQIK